jgi:hypothetical protein
MQDAFWGLSTTRGQLVNTHSERRVLHTYHGASCQTPTLTPVEGYYAPTCKYHCTEPSYTNSSHIVNVPHTYFTLLTPSSLFSLSQNRTILQVNQTYSSLLIDTYDFSIKQAPRRVPPREEKQTIFDLYWGRQHIWYAASPHSAPKTSNLTHQEADPEHSQRVSSTVNPYSLLYTRMLEISSSNIV